MEEWKIYRLGDIISISSGFPYKGELIGYGEHYLLGMGCVSFKEIFLNTGIRHYAGEAPERYNAYPGDIILATRQQSDNLPILGMPAFIPNKYIGKKMIIGANLYRVQNNSDFSNEYIFWLLKSPAYVHHIRSCQTGTTVRMITKANIEDFHFNAPGNEERKIISDFLWNLEKKIELNRRINDNLEQQAQALFKSWFVDFEPFKDGKFVESELGMIPEGWRVGSFLECVKVSGGGTPKTDNSDYWNGVIPFFTPKDASNTTYTFETEKNITELGVSNCNSPIYPKNTVFITARGTVGKIRMAGIPMAMNQSCYALLPSTKNTERYVYLQVLKLIAKMQHKANGAVFAAITTKDFDECVIIPASKSIDEFIRFVNPVFDQIHKKGLENRNLTRLRNLLLPKLMSGELKINNLHL